MIQRIPGDTMSICGGQINEGEPIGTIINTNAVGVSTPIVGHKRCADKHNYAKANPPVVKIAKQGSDGSIGKYEDALVNPSPLVRPEKQELPPMPEGVQSIADLPFEEPFHPATAAHAGVPDAGAVNPELRERVMREADADTKRTESIYRDGFHGTPQPKIPNTGDDWANLIAVLNNHRVFIDGKLLTDLVMWKNS
jgi:hypothetical protein